MSYNYDLNPWDDNYSSTNANQTPGAGGYGSQAYIDNNQQYSNSPANQYDQQQYSDYTTGGSPQQQYQDSAGMASGTDMGQSEPSTNKGAEHGFVGRFLRQHVPLCGSILDTLSSINLPFIDALLQHINRDLLVSKVFYFFFYSAFGSLFPLMGVYFKQLGMNPSQVGILTGVRPFIEIFSAPFWNSLASRFQKSKALLLFSLLSWTVFTYSLAHIRPPASACVAFNDSDYVLYTPYSANDLSNYDINQSDQSETTGELKTNGTSTASGDIKDEILVKEENQNDQGRRRRRQISLQDSTGSFDVDSEDSGGLSGVDRLSADRATGGGLELQVDLENDFDDTRLIRDLGREQDDESVDSTADDQSLSARRSRSRRRKRSYYKRAEASKSRGNDQDDLFGGGGGGSESEESEAESNEELAGSNDDNGSNSRSDDTSASNNYNGANDNAIGAGDEEAAGGSGSNDYTGVESESSEGNGSVDNKHNGRLVQSNRHGSNDDGDNDETGEAEASASSQSTMTAESTGRRAEIPATAAATVATTTQTTPTKSRRVFKQRHKTPPTHIVGMSPITVEYAVNYNKDKHSRFVTPMFSTIVYKLDDIKEVFFLLLLLISLGEFFSAPAITLADSATLSYLGEENVDLYGRQRMFGSFGWAVTLLLVGMALDNATSIADHPCGPHQRERSYTVCFVIFSLLMACALMTSTQFRFSYPKKASNGGANQAAVAVATDGGANGFTGNVKTTLADGSPGNIDQLYASTQPRSIFNTAPPVNAPPPDSALGASGGPKEKFEFLDKWKSAVFAQRTRELPEWVNVFRQFQNSLHLMYLFITWFLGCGVGLVFTFLFWHLQDVGGTPTLFGICSVINHISEIMAYFFSSSVIKRVGHTRVLSVGLGCNVIRFIYVAFLSNPYYALPFELVQGITHAACFAACCSYMSHVSKPELRTSTQGVMQGLHHGIGRACGALLGGYAINTIGSRASFCIYGLLSGLVLGGFLYIRKRCVSSIGDGQDRSVIEPDAKMVDQSEAAIGGFGAPQGVPSALPNTKIAATEWEW